jgi:hypothetical protein
VGRARHPTRRDPWDRCFLAPCQGLTLTRELQPNGLHPFEIRTERTNSLECVFGPRFPDRGMIARIRRRTPAKSWGDLGARSSPAPGARATRRSARAAPRGPALLMRSGPPSTRGGRPGGIPLIRSRAPIHRPTGREGYFRGVALPPSTRPARGPDAGPRRIRYGSPWPGRRGAHRPRLEGRTLPGLGKGSVAGGSASAKSGADK